MPGRVLRTGGVYDPLSYLVYQPGLLRQRNEFGRRNISKPGMLPAQQGLGPYDTPAFQIPLGLVHQRHLFVIERMVQFV
ncbi:hypothetical protein D9M71_458690 [compost metagenome]